VSSEISDDSVFVTKTIKYPQSPLIIESIFNHPNGGASLTKNIAHAPRPASIEFSSDCSRRSGASAGRGGFIARYFFFRFRFCYDAFGRRRGPGITRFCAMLLYRRPVRGRASTRPEEIVSMFW